jgi:opacity protein-like surface antigen
MRSVHATTMRRGAVALLLALPCLAAAAEPAVEPAGGGGWTQRFSGVLGWGYYETAHAGVAYHFGERAALDVFAGAGFAFQPDTVSAGLGFRHHVGPPVRTVQAGWDLKALYWTQSDASYDWKMMSLVAGAYAVKDLDAHLSLKLDAGVALSWALQSDRKQSQDFSSPQRWNGTVCLELLYRFGR